jgi:hypothetical protein
MTKLDELSERIKGLQQKIWSREKVVCGPGPLREKLRAEIRDLYTEKKTLNDARNRIISEKNAACVQNEFNAGVLSNETRSAQEIRADIDKANETKRLQTLRELREISATTLVLR